MAKNSKTIAADPIDEWCRSTSFSFGGKGGLSIPEGFSELDLDDKVTVTVTGTVTRLSKDSDESNLSIRMDKIDLQVAPEPDEKVSLKAALAKSKKSRKL